MLAAVRVRLYVCANHFTSDHFSNEDQYKAGFASTQTPPKWISPNHTGSSNCTQVTGKCRHVLIVFPVSYEYGEVSLKLVKLVKPVLVRYAMAFEAS